MEESQEDQSTQESATPAAAKVYSYFIALLLLDVVSCPAVESSGKAGTCTAFGLVSGLCA